MTNQAKNKIIKLAIEGKSMREISKIVTYAGKNNKVKNVSIGVVHKIINENTENLHIKNLSDNPVHKLPNLRTDWKKLKNKDCKFPDRKICNFNEGEERCKFMKYNNDKNFWYCDVNNENR